ncbi:hypothetical protein AAE478_000739 [Parahypoxylon ruwenzoriense]
MQTGVELFDRMPLANFAQFRGMEKHVGDNSSQSTKSILSTSADTSQSSKGGSRLESTSALAYQAQDLVLEAEVLLAPKCRE